MSTYVAGIDGGQSSTVAFVADERGKILGRGTAGPADEVGAGKESTRLADALSAALDAARSAAQLPETTRYAAIVAGISGYEGRIYGKQPELPAERLVLMHDAPIAHAGALAGKPGVIVIAGTGSVVYAKNERGDEVTLGGWGYLFGDEGSAFAIVRESLAWMMRRQDDGFDESQSARAHFGVGSLRELVRAVYSGEISRDALAAYAKQLPSSQTVRDFAYLGIDRLAELVRIAVAKTQTPKVALLGGLADDARFRGYLSDRIRELEPNAQIVEPRYEPAAGALLFAYHELGTPVEELIVT